MNWKNGFRKKGTSMKTIDIRIKDDEVEMLRSMIGKELSFWRNKCSVPLDTFAVLIPTTYCDSI